MDLKKDDLEGGPRLAQVRKTKKYLMITQVVLIFAIVVLLSIMDGQFQAKPFYYNIGSFIYFVILMVLIVGVESMIFRVLEVRYTKSTSSKYYMLKTSFKRSLIIIIVAAIVLAIVATPLLGSVISGVYNEEGTTATTASFNNRDALGLTTVDSIHVQSNGIAEVIVLTEENYLAYSGNLLGMRQHATVYTTNTIQGVDLDFPHTPFGQYRLVVVSDTPVEVTYTIHKAATPYFVGFISMFAILFIAFYAVWSAYIMPVRRQYAKAAIYR